MIEHLRRAVLRDSAGLGDGDLRGHGEYQKPGEISIRHFAEDVISLLKGLEIESAHICGLSMGGMVAYEMARQLNLPNNARGHPRRHGRGR